jgi:hypothetical protein
VTTSDSRESSWQRIPYLQRDTFNAASAQLVVSAKRLDHGSLARSQRPRFIRVAEPSFGCVRAAARDRGTGPVPIQNAVNVVKTVRTSCVALELEAMWQARTVPAAACSI